MLKWLLPDEWIMKLFPPNEDNEQGVSIYLHLIESDISIKLQSGISRYELIEFIKKIHDDYDSVSDNIHDLTTQHLVIPPHIASNKIIACFHKEKVVFMTDSNIEIEHNKNDNGKWITMIFSENKKGRKHIATISTEEDYNENNFTSHEQQCEDSEAED